MLRQRSHKRLKHGYAFALRHQHQLIQPDTRIFFIGILCVRDWVLFFFWVDDLFFGSKLNGIKSSSLYHSLLGIK